MPQSPSPPRSKSEAGVVKHRACDECRTRKLACTKEPNGCSRCLKEGLKCIYSAQKPMGRPRKRRHVEDSDGQQTPPEAVPAAQPDASVSSSSQFAFGPQPSSSSFLDIDYSAMYGTDDYANMGELDMSSFDFYSPMNGLPQTMGTMGSADYGHFSMGYTEPQWPLGGLQYGGVDLLGGITFDEEDPANKQVSEDINKTAMNILSSQLSQADQTISTSPPQQQPPPVAASTPSPPQLSESTSCPSSSARSPVSSATSPEHLTSKECPNGLCYPKSLPVVSCTCSSQIFLALDAVARLPDDISEAMSVARGATKTTHDVILCPQCSRPHEHDVSRPPPIQSFQNMMMLGALIAGAGNAYARILEMVDTKTAEAKRNQQTITFRFSDYGGLWAYMKEFDSATCDAVRLYNNKEMNPDHWRLTIRALLKIDVYGFSVEQTATTSGAHFTRRHLGLKDVINTMEERSRRRHDKIDALVAAGQSHPHAGIMIGPKQTNCPEPGQRPCMKVVDLARVALEKLEIS